MADWDKGAVRVSESAILGNQLLEIPEPRLRDTGVLTVEQLRAFEIRLHKYIGAQVADSINLLSERLVMVDGRTQEQIERIGREAAERGVDFVVRLVALDQRSQERASAADELMVEGFATQRKQLAETGIELAQAQEVQRQALVAAMALDRDMNQIQYRNLVDYLIQFQQDVESRTALGRLRRFKAWLGSLVRSVRYGR